MSKMTIDLTCKWQEHEPDEAPICAECGDQIFGKCWKLVVTILNGVPHVSKECWCAACKEVRS